MDFLGSFDFHVLRMDLDDPRLSDHISLFMGFVPPFLILHQNISHVCTARIHDSRDYVRYVAVDSGSSIG